ncbi:hypothetical protein VNO77_20213 [Canavalia gladiata]|uniref:Uncharacterized protein n=1 Tax=Canavalia gladiata TaxID=3824 RepID=A0AAN9LP45_CANGL
MMTTTEQATRKAAEKRSLQPSPLFASGKIEDVDSEPKEGIGFTGISCGLHTRFAQVSGSSYTTFESRNSKIRLDYIQFS